jgi:hypothetical protein
MGHHKIICIYPHNRIETHLHFEAFVDMQIVVHIMRISEKLPVFQSGTEEVDLFEPKTSESMQGPS